MSVTVEQLEADIKTPEAKLETVEDVVDKLFLRAERRDLRAKRRALLRAGVGPSNPPRQTPSRPPDKWTRWAEQQGLMIQREIDVKREFARALGKSKQGYTKLDKTA
ncbi:hypothetical protein WJX72_002438 [[Myrmecia] bisecta]|uniref:Uncharacterized protein n=1 Tax=[Myrmecia] bisecta TaxID=41462 RepID=A0AAW1QEF9_9CHLO